MLKEINLENIGSSKNDIILKGNGKILKIFIEFLNIDKTTNVTLYTKEGEEIININNDEIKKVLYPRVSVVSEKYENTALNSLNEDLDYFYFKGGLILHIDKEDFSPKSTLENVSFEEFDKIKPKTEERIIIKKFILLYDNLNG